MIIHGINATKNDLRDFYQLLWILQSDPQNGKEMATDLLKTIFDAREFHRKWTISGALKVSITSVNLARNSICKRLKNERMLENQFGFVIETLQDTTAEIERLTDPVADQNRWVQTEMLWEGI